MQKLSVCLISLAVFSLIFVTFLHPITAFSQDLGRHLLLGKLIYQTHHVPKTNLLSYTYPDFPFVNHHYLSEVSLYLLTKIGGNSLLQIIMTLITLLSFALIFLYGLKKSHILIIGGAASLYLQIFFDRIDIRPEMFGYLLFSLVLVLLYRFYCHPGKYILVLIPLLWLWQQLHISYVLGYCLIAIFLLDSLFKKKKPFLSSASKLLLLTLMLSVVVSIINPNLFNGATYPLRIFQNYGYSIEENQNIFLLESLTNKPTIPYFKLSVLLLFALLLLNFKKTKPYEWMLSLLFTYLAGSSVRNFPFFVLATFIPFTTALYQLHLKYRSYFPTPPRFSYPLLVCLLLLVLSLNLKIQLTSFGLGTETGASRAADFLLKQGLSGRIFNNFDIGSYLAYRIYPQQVFLDGRPEAYPAGFLQNIYIPMQEDPKLFEQMANKYNFQTIFFAHTDQTPWAKSFLSSILKNPNWVSIYLDHSVLILVRRNEQHKSLIALYGMKEPLVKNTSSYTKQEIVQLLSFQLQSDNKPEVIKLLKRALDLDHKDCQLLLLLSKLSPTGVKTYQQNLFSCY